MLTSISSTEHMYTRPAALSVLHPFRYLSVLSNVQDLIRSTSSLPNARDVVNCKNSLSNVRGDVHFLPRCHQPAVLCHCVLVRPSACLFTTSALKTAPPVSIGVHPILRIVGSLVRDYVNHFVRWHRHLDIVAHTFLISFRHVYTVLKHCYLFHRLSRPCPTLLRVEMQRRFFLKHDFKAHMQRLSRNVFYSHVNCLRNLAFNCFRRKFHLSWQCKGASPCAVAWRFRQSRRKPCFRILTSSPCLTFRTKPRAVCRVGVRHVGGGSPRGISWASISTFAKSIPESFDSCSTLCYAAHVHEDDLKIYPPVKYIYAAIPLDSMMEVLPLAHVRSIAKLHGVAVGSRCNAASVNSYIGKHSCPKCTEYITVFSIEKNAAAKHVDRSVRSRAFAKVNASALEASGRSAKNLTPKKREMPVIETDNISASFPPEPASKDLEHAIIRDACKRMDPENFEEVGCAVCGELKLRKDTSRLKSVKNLLNILEAPGVTRMERKSDSRPIREYKGPVLDYGCSNICNSCRGDIRRGKVPRLALSNNLWLGAVPSVLKNLSFVEKILVARVRHTCAFVKVASGMRKMKANIVAFESPIPKIYNILPPPREELDEVLAILFTGPAKPTEKDFARTPFLVRRNAVINALEWLRLNHSDYSDIEISHDNASQYGEDMPPVTVEYQLKLSNKVPEGTSVFDHEEEDGTVEGDCVFTVHGLTGELCNSMTPSALKAMALRHLNSGGKVLAVGHSDKLESMWNNPQLYPQMFPWLFPYGLGGIGSAKISDKEHKRHLLMYYDKRFQIDVNFPFVAFSHEQMKANTTQSYLLVDQSRFTDMSQRLMNVNWSTLNELARRMEAGEHVSPKTEAEKKCFQIIRDLDAASGKMHGSTTSKKYMRNEIWSLINYLGSPSWYITLSPADIQHPICIYFADTKEKFTPALSAYDERARLVCQNPVAGARFFDFMVRTFLEDVLGVRADKREGFYGHTSGYYGTVEQQGRLTLHLHMLLWIAGNMNPEDLRVKILKESSVWRQNLITWLERCHSGDFLSGSHAEVSSRTEQLKEDQDYLDPTQTLPVPPPPPCQSHPDLEVDGPKDCDQCNALLQWNDTYCAVVDDLLLRSNVHNCNRGVRKDGTRKKNKTYAGCMDNKMGKCKARFPRPTAPTTSIDDTGAIMLKKLEAWINTFTPMVTYLLCCNTDVTSLASGTAIKGVIMYISDYITKSALKTHVIFDSIRTVFQRNGEMIGGTLPQKEKARRFMTKIANLLSAKAEMGAPMISMYLLNNPDHYTGHKFITFFWEQFVNEARRDFSDTGSNSESTAPQRVAIIKKKGRIVGLSVVHDYIYRPQELAEVNLYDWIRCYKRERITRTSIKVDLDEPTDPFSNDVGLENPSVDAEPVVDLMSDAETSDEELEDASAKCRGRKNLMSFGKEHPLSDSHAVRRVKDNLHRVPNFAGAYLPRCDRGDREYYCSTMLTLFRPWRRGTDLKKPEQLWDTAFQEYSFTPEQERYMRNFNVRYECLDARDDYRSQMMKDANPIAGSWLKDSDGEIEDEPHSAGLEDIQFDDLPSDALNLGPNQKRRAKEMDAVRRMMTGLGWTDPLYHIRESESPVSFTPDVFKPGNAWEQDIDIMKQKLLDEKRAHHLNSSRGCNKDADMQETTPYNVRTPNVVKVVDKSYLDRKFYKEGHSEVINSTVLDFSLNKEQERAFRIIANHAISENPEQLRMYLGGMGGTGKTQVIKALSCFFTQRNEAHRFVIVAPTGTAAALLGGSTYHSTFGINDNSGISKIGKIKQKLAGVEYVFFDEVSMLSARDMYRINLQLSRVLDVAHAPFGGLNLVFSGDFAQLPPAVGGEHVSLYSKTIGAIATDMKSQEEAVGKALWHQVTTVVILRQNMRQKKQSAEDGKLRTCLENMRYKACTPDDIAFLRTRISSSVPGRPSICHELFRDVSIITSTNLHKDEINRLGAIRFAQETGQSLTDFFSDDSPRAAQGDSEEGKGVKRVAELTNEMKVGLWSQHPSSTDKHIAGKLSLCIGLPVMIRYNFATEICMTRGQEGFVQGWQSKTGSSGQLVLDTLFVKLKDPPSHVQLPGLPENVVPVYATTTNVRVMLPNDEKYYVARTQVEVLVNFAMTDFASQGKTRPYNVSDLNNLRSHQSYYTALSRSATAEGTLILQGFDPRQIVGGCSGALRQELRELELLDDVTRLRHSGKLPVSVDGDTRNNIITSFRKWKGSQYVPSFVHSAIRWSKRSPWIETEILDLDERLAALEKLREKKKEKKEKDTANLKLDGNPSPSAKKVVVDLGLGKPSTQKRRRSSGMMSKRVLSAASIHRANRQKLQRQPNISAGRDYTTAPIGMRWSQNSCAYDSIFTPIYALWCAYGDIWTEEIQRTGSVAAVQLIEGFICFEEGRGSLEDARDKVRRTLARTQQGCAYGSYTSLDNVCGAWFKTSKVIFERFYQCPDGHRICHSYDYDAYFSTTVSHGSISQWVSIDTAQTSTLCEICSRSVGIRLKFCSCPPLLAFELSDPATFIDRTLSVRIENQVQRYVLAAVIYYAHEHFTSQVITRDGRVWFYDGMAVADQNTPTLEHVGSINDTSFDLQSCRGGSPSLVLYARI